VASYLNIKLKVQLVHNTYLMYTCSNVWGGGQDSIEGIGHVPGKIEETSTVFTAAGQHGTCMHIYITVYM